MQASPKRGRLASRPTVQFGGVKMKGAWNVVVPSGMGGNFHPLICERAHAESAPDPTVSWTIVASKTSPEAVTESATTSFPLSHGRRLSSLP